MITTPKDEPIAYLLIGLGMIAAMSYAYYQVKKEQKPTKEDLK